MPVLKDHTVVEVLGPYQKERILEVVVVEQKRMDEQDVVQLEFVLLLVLFVMFQHKHLHQMEVVEWD